MNICLAKYADTFFDKKCTQNYIFFEILKDLENVILTDKVNFHFLSKNTSIFVIDTLSLLSYSIMFLIHLYQYFH